MLVTWTTIWFKNQFIIFYNILNLCFNPQKSHTNAMISRIHSYSFGFRFSQSPFHLQYWVVQWPSCPVVRPVSMRPVLVAKHCLHGGLIDLPGRGCNWLPIFRYLWIFITIFRYFKTFRFPIIDNFHKEYPISTIIPAYRYLTFIPTIRNLLILLRYFDYSTPLLHPQVKITCGKLRTE